MTYKEWADDYLESAQKLKAKIADLKAQKETASISELSLLNRRIISLYNMYLDCVHTSDELARRKGVAF